MPIALGSGAGGFPCMMGPVDKGIGEMWRAFFLAVGITLCILGGECLLIDRAVMAQSPDEATAAAGEAASRDIIPPDWAPWSLLSAGAVVMIYSFTIPKRINS